MNNLTKINWDCVEWISNPTYSKRVKRFKVLSIRGSLSSAVVPRDDVPITRIENGVQYIGRLIGSNKTDSVFDLFTNILSFNDMKMFLKSNNINENKFDGPGIILRAFLLLLDLNERQILTDKRDQLSLLEKQLSTKNSSNSCGSTPELNRLSKDLRIKLVPRSTEANSGSLAKKINISVVNEEEYSKIKTECDQNDESTVFEVNFNQNDKNSDLEHFECIEEIITPTPELANGQQTVDFYVGEEDIRIMPPRIIHPSELSAADLSSLAKPISMSTCTDLVVHSFDRNTNRKRKQSFGRDKTMACYDGGGTMGTYMTPTLTKITTELSSSGSQMSVLFHFDIDGVTFGARRETLYKSKDQQKVVMYLKCVNYSPNTTGCKWKCRLKVKHPDEPIGSPCYLDVSNYDIIANTKASDHALHCKQISKMKMDENQPPVKLNCKFDPSWLEMNHKMIPGTSWNQS